MQLFPRPLLCAHQGLDSLDRPCPVTGRNLSRLMALTVAGSLTVTLFLAGCRGPAGSEPSAVRTAAKAAGSDLDVYVYPDVTTSLDEAKKREYFRFGNKALEEMPYGKNVAAYAFYENAAPALVFDFRASDAEGSDLARVNKWLVGKQFIVNGTFAAPVFRHLLQAVRDARKKGRRVIAIIATDGLWQDYDEARAIVRELAAEPNLIAVWVMPIDTDADPSARTKVAGVLAPLGSDRGLTSNRFDASDGIDRLHALALAPPASSKSASTSPARKEASKK